VQTDLLDEAGWHHLQRGQAMAEEEKIKLRCTMGRDSKIKVTDQHGREFDVTDPAVTPRGRRQVPMEIELELPYWSLDGPTAIIKFSVPVEISA
jgi:hypothetical protein